MADAEPSEARRPVTRLGSYRLVEPLGSGGMSSVFRGEHVESGSEVAIKVLPRYLARQETLLRRFLREAQNAESLEHPNIVSIYDRGSEGGRHYLVLEYVDGPDLHDHVRRDGPLEVLEAIRVVEQAAEGLRHAASKGLIHRDIKPANLLVAPDGSVKLIDLGLALQSEAEDERVTRHGTTVGTVDYMAPEQARDSRGATLRSDIYSLGCTFYYLLTGFAPFPGGTIADKLRRHANQPAPDVRQLRHDVPRPVAQLIRRMMEKSPDARFGSYEELIDALHSLDLEAVSNGSLEYALIAEDDDADFELGEGVETARSVSSTLDVEPVSPPSGSGSAEPPVAPELDLGELKDLLDDEDEPAARRPKPPRSEKVPAPRPARPRAVEGDPGVEPFDPFADLEGDGDEPSDVPLSLGPRRSYGEEASAKAWAIGGALIGLVIALLGFAIINLIRMDWSGGG